MTPSIESLQTTSESTECVLHFTFTLQAKDKYRTIYLTDQALGRHRQTLPWFLGDVSGVDPTCNVWAHVFEQRKHLLVAALKIDLKPQVVMLSNFIFLVQILSLLKNQGMNWNESFRIEVMGS